MIISDDQFPAVPTQPAPTQFRVNRLPPEAAPVPVVELATATPVGVHVVYLDPQTVAGLIGLLFDGLDPDGQREVSGELFRRASGLVLPDSLTLHGAR